MEIQSELQAPKGQYNKFGNYKYRSCEDILAAVKPLLKKNKCTLVISDEITSVENRVYVKATAVLSNEKGESVTTVAFAREEEMKRGMDASQVTGAASSYARKYALNGLFAIDDTKDADALNNSKEYTQQAAPQASQTNKPAPKKLSKKEEEEFAMAFDLCRPDIERAKDREELKVVMDRNKALNLYIPYTEAINEKWKQLS